MQTFLPYPDYRECARVLDYRRLGKQRVEAWQILRAMKRVKGGWVNHPAVNMWRGYEESLNAYGREMCLEWIARGYNDTMLERFVCVDAHEPPAWLGDSRIHISHQSNLIRKDPLYYQPLFPEVPDNLAYFWVTKEQE